MPKGPQGQKRPTDAIGNAIRPLVWNFVRIGPHVPDRKAGTFWEIGDIVKLIEGQDADKGQLQMNGAELMRKVVAAFGNSDLKPLMDAIHEEIVWKTASKHEEVFRFDGEYKNRPGVLDVLSKISMDYTFHYLRPKEILAVEDVVWGLFDASVSYDPKDRGVPAKALALEIAVRWRLKDGKIIEHQGFFDTASVLIQQGLIVDPALEP